MAWGLGAGRDHLRGGVDAGPESGPTDRVKLPQDIVGQKERGHPAALPVPGKLGEAQGQGNAPLLTLRGEILGADPCDLQDKVVAVGTAEGRAKHQVASEARLESLSDQEAIQLIFLPGFSTAAEISDVSGRGVGMDAVRSAVEQSIEVVRTRGEALGVKVLVGDHHTFVFSENVFGALVQYPDTFGAIHDFAPFIAKAHEAVGLLKYNESPSALMELQPRVLGTIEKLITAYYYLNAAEIAEKANKQLQKEGKKTYFTDADLLDAGLMARNAIEQAWEHTKQSKLE